MKVGMPCLALALALAGCATYQEPDPGTPHAELIVASTLGAHRFDEAAGSSQVSFFAWADPLCNEAHGLLARFEGLDGSQQQLRVAAGKPIYIRAAWSQVVTRGNQSEMRTCANLVSFLPDAGQAYEISQSVGGVPSLGCVTTVRNMDGYRPVKSLREHPVEGKCR